MFDWQQARRAIDVVAGKWTLSVLATLEVAPRRYNELLRAVGDGITAKVLSDTLHHLIDANFVRRNTVDTAPPAVIYALTPLAESVFEPLEYLSQWARRHARELPAEAGVAWR